MGGKKRLKEISNRKRESLKENKEFQEKEFQHHRELKVIFRMTVGRDSQGRKLRLNQKFEDI